MIFAVFLVLVHGCHRQLCAFRVNFNVTPYLIFGVFFCVSVEVVDTSQKQLTL